MKFADRIMTKEEMDSEQSKAMIQNFIIRCKIMRQMSDFINIDIKRNGFAKIHDVLKIESYIRYVDLGNENSGAVEALVFIKRFPKFLSNVNTVKEQLEMLESNHSEANKMAERTLIISDNLSKIVNFYEDK